MPTYNIWKGNAAPVRDVWHITPANVEDGDTFLVTINGKSVSVTVDGDTMAYDATLGYVPALVDALVAALTTASQSLYFPEFAEVTWTAGTNDDGDSTHVVGTGPEDGKPVTISASATDSGSFGVTVATIQAGSAGQNEIQQIAIPSATSGGTFTITFEGQTTGNIAYDASAATVQTALEALSNIASGDVTVTGASPTWTVEFEQAYAATNVAAMTANGANLTGAAMISVATSTQGGAGRNEIFYFDVPTGHLFSVTINSPVSSGEFATTTISESATANQLRNSLHYSLEYTTGVQAITEGADFIVTKTAITGGSRFQVEVTGTWGNADFATAIDETHPLGVEVYDATYTVTILTTQVQDGSSSAVSEIQVVTILGGPTGGTFTLTFQGQTTSGIAYNASAATVEAALESLSNVTDVTVTKSGTSYTVTFVDPTGDIAQMTASAAGLTGGTPTIVTTQEAVAATNERQLVSLTNSPSEGTFTLTGDFGSGDETTGNIAYNASASTVQTALIALTTPVSGDLIVTGADGGPWTIEFSGNFAAADASLLSGSAANLTGSGTQTLTASHATTGTGPNYGDNAANWSQGTVPANTHTIVLENSDVSILYGIDDMEYAGIEQRASYTGHLGLPRWTGTYYEYRNTEFTAGSGAASTLNINIGLGDGAGSGLMRHNFGGKTVNLNVHHTADSDDGEVPAITFRNGTVTAAVYRGTAGAGYFKGESVTLASPLIGYRDSQDTDSTLIIGESATVTGAIKKTGGALYLQCDADALVDVAGESYIEGDAELKSLKSSGATIYHNSTGTLGKQMTITGITAADPAVVTFSAAHGLTTGDKIRIASVAGMVEVNQREFTVSVASGTTVELIGEDSSGHTAYSSGGVAGLRGSISVSGSGVLTFDGLLKARSAAVPIDIHGDASQVIDTAKKVTTSTYGSGEFAVTYHYASRYADLGSNVTLVRRDED